MPRHLGAAALEDVLHRAARDAEGVGDAARAVPLLAQAQDGGPRRSGQASPSSFSQLATRRSGVGLRLSEAAAHLLALGRRELPGEPIAQVAQAAAGDPAECAQVREQHRRRTLLGRIGAAARRLLRAQEERWIGEQRSRASRRRRHVRGVQRPHLAARRLERSDRGRQPDRRPPGWRAPRAPGTSSPRAPRSRPGAPAPGSRAAAPRPAPAAGSPSSRSCRSGAPSSSTVRPNRSRNSREQPPLLERAVAVGATHQPLEQERLGLREVPRHRAAPCRAAGARARARACSRRRAPGARRRQRRPPPAPAGPRPPARRAGAPLAAGSSCGAPRSAGPADGTRDPRGRYAGTPSISSFAAGGSTRGDPPVDPGTWPFITSFACHTSSRPRQPRISAPWTPNSSFARSHGTRGNGGGTRGRSRSSSAAHLPIRQAIAYSG